MARKHLWKVRDNLEVARSRLNMAEEAARNAGDTMGAAKIAAIKEQVKKLQEDLRTI